MPHPVLRPVPVVLAFALAGCGGGGGEAPAGATATASPGAKLYVQNCIACHQRNGEGVPGVQPALAGTPVTIGDPQELLGWVMFGERPASLPKGEYRGVMPQYAYLGDEDMAALLTHVRSSFGNSASAITPAMVAEVRAARRR